MGKLYMLVKRKQKIQKRKKKKKKDKELNQWDYDENIILGQNQWDCTWRRKSFNLKRM